jgi:hypothetical protein
MLDFDAVRKIGLALPNVVDARAYGARALKLNGKLLAFVPVNKSAEADCVVVRVGFERRARLLREHPEAYYITDHYASHPTVLVRLGQITRKNLQHLLREAWRFVSTPSKGSQTKSLTRGSVGKPAARMSSLGKMPRKR